jgi:hypothetical protein
VPFANAAIPELKAKCAASCRARCWRARYKSRPCAAREE